MDGEGEFHRALEKAFRLLALRDRSEKELRRKLESAKFSPAVVDGVIERCRDLGYIDDARFARTLACTLAASRLLGNRRISFDLQERGIDGDIAAQAIAAADRELNEEQRLRSILEKRRTGRPADESNGDTSVFFKQKARLVRNMMGRGFSPGLILQVINEREEEGFHGNDGG